jgi:hypothetical protein
MLIKRVVAGPVSRARCMQQIQLYGVWIGRWVEWRDLVAAREALSSQH